MVGGLLGCTGVALEDVPDAPIAFVREEPGSVSDFAEFAEALQLVGPEGPTRKDRPSRAKVALLVVPTGEIRPLPDSGPQTYPLDWSADGLRLLVGRLGDGYVELFEWNRLTGAWDRLRPPYSRGAAALGGGPIRLALIEYGGRHARGTLRPLMVDVDHAGLKRLPGTIGGTDPDVSRDGRQVVFVKPDPRGTREPRIMLADLDGGDPRPLTRGSQPRFSRDGASIVFVVRRRGNADIWIMRANGTGKRLLVSSSFDEEFPALSPDGRFVVYASVREGGVSQLYMTRLEDGVEAQLTRAGQNGRPVW
jgi:hypothetical protein